MTDAILCAKVVGTLSQAEEATLAAIEQDVSRTYGVALEPTGVADTARHQSPAEDRLRRLLTSFCLTDKATGYCQGMNFIAATLLQHCAREDDAWALFVRLMHARPYHLAPLFAVGMKGLRSVCLVVDKLVAAHIPGLAAHFARHGITSIHYHEWFYALFTLVLPPDMLACVWDEVFANGYAPTTYRVVLALLRHLWPRYLEGSDAHTTLMALKGFARSRALAVARSEASGSGSGGGGGDEASMDAGGSSHSGTAPCIEPPADLLQQLRSKELLAVTAGQVAQLMREAEAEMARDEA